LLQGGEKLCDLGRGALLMIAWIEAWDDRSHDARGLACAMRLFNGQLCPPGAGQKNMWVSCGVTVAPRGALE
jgi:hypothetical protein